MVKLALYGTKKWTEFYQIEKEEIEKNKENMKTFSFDLIPINVGTYRY